ncbi:hypothetical protein SELMODRAFT_412707 [Selaginella moellendorffii]|uniref:Uncharacterized protein n=1 Tax=Selaginella moellendorffii TaxID=88036 RepID=D8RL83_SELML|nr:hypothetical protein SELMODRAFT_412707 [Selaginella moellendorffii]
MVDTSYEVTIVLEKWVTEASKVVGNTAVRMTCIVTCANAALLGLDWMDAIGAKIEIRERQLTFSNGHRPVKLGGLLKPESSHKAFCCTSEFKTFAPIKQGMYLWKEPCKEAIANKVFLVDRKVVLLKADADITIPPMSQDKPDILMANLTTSTVNVKSGDPIAEAACEDISDIVCYTAAYGLDALGLPEPFKNYVGGVSCMSSEKLPLDEEALKFLGRIKGELKVGDMLSVSGDF